MTAFGQHFTIRKAGARHGWALPLPLGAGTARAAAWNGSLALQHAILGLRLSLLSQCPPRPALHWASRTLTQLRMLCCAVQVPVNKMDPNYSHPLIHIYLLKRRKQPLEPEAAAAEAAAEAEAAVAGGGAAGEEGGAAAGEEAQGAAAAGAEAGGAVQQAAAAAEEQQGSSAGSSGGEGEPAALPLDGSGSGDPARAARSQEQFKTRRQGAMLAKMFKDVKLDGLGPSE